MNKFIGIGRLTRDPEIRYAQTATGNSAIARYTLAIDRKFRRDGEATADFINCIAFGKSAEFVEKYLKQGVKIAIVGRIQTGSYTNKDGVKVYTTDIVVEEHEFVESKAASQKEQNNHPAPAPENASSFMDIPDGIADELPFN